MGVNLKKIYIKIWFFHKVQKSQNKVGVAKEIVCGNDIVLHKFAKELNWDEKKDIA